MPSTVRALAAAVAVAAIATLSRANNVTIDDTNQLWTYTPTAVWGPISASKPCPSCQVNPDPEQTYQETWHDCSSVGTATLAVTAATAITIYTICPGPLAGGSTYVLNASFLLDGAPAGEFHGPTGGCAEDTYNYPIYHVDNLPLKSHTLQILNRITNQQFHDSDLLIDYAVIDDGTPQSTTVTGTGATASSTSAEQTQTAVPSHSSFPVAAVVVPIVLVLLLAAGVGFWLSRRRRRNRPVNDTLEATPYHEADTGRPSVSTAAAAPVSFYSSASRSVHADDVTESTTTYPTTPHDPQLEAALAIIADRAARSQGSGSQSGSGNVSAAQAQARRPEKATYRSNSNASAPALQRAASTTHSSSAGSHSRALSTLTIDPAGLGGREPAPPSYIDSIPRH